MQRLIDDSLIPPKDNSDDANPNKPVFPPLTYAQLLQMPPKTWLIDHVISRGDLGMIYGAPGSEWKTVVAIDLIMAACTGTTWADRFAIPSKLAVGYCAGEGLAGLPFVDRFNPHPIRRSGAICRWGI